MTQGRANESSLTLDPRTVSPSSVARIGKKDSKSLLSCRRKEGGNANGANAQKKDRWVRFPIICIMDAHAYELSFVRPFEGLWRGWLRKSSGLH